MINQEREKIQKDLLLRLLKLYSDTYDRSPELFTEGDSYTLAPLADLIAEVFDQLSHDDVINSLKLLGSQKIDNHSENLISKLCQGYLDEEVIDKIFKEDFDRFVRLAEVWPKFLNNKPLLDKLSVVTGEELDLDTQAKVISIQTMKNLIVPKLIINHYQNFIQLSDKSRVRTYLQQFINSLAYTGHTSGLDMPQLSQVIRRIFKSPDKMQSDFLLNFLLILAVDNANFAKFDEKTKKFVDDCLDFVEE